MQVYVYVCGCVCVCACPYGPSGSSVVWLMFLEDSLMWLTGFLKNSCYSTPDCECVCVHVSELQNLKIKCPFYSEKYINHTSLSLSYSHRYINTHTVLGELGGADESGYGEAVPWADGQAAYAAVVPHQCGPLVDVSVTALCRQRQIGAHILHAFTITLKGEKNTYINNSLHRANVVFKGPIHIFLAFLKQMSLMQYVNTDRKSVV